MARKIKFHSLHILFQFFAFLADKTGGWHLFVKPKMLLGSLLLGIGLTGCGAKTENNPKNKQANKKDKDSILNIKTRNNTNNVDNTTCYMIDTDDSIYYIEQMPQFPEGEKELFQFIKKELKYPQQAIRNGIQGIVVCRFVITEKGAIEQVQIIRSVDPDCDKEVIRVVNKFPKWIPGKQNGKNVAVWYNLPIRFELPKNK